LVVALGAFGPGSFCPGYSVIDAAAAAVITITITGKDAADVSLDKFFP